MASERERREEDQQKRIIKEAIKEWLDEQFAAFGRWTFYGLVSMIIAAIVAFSLWINGKH